MDQKTHTHKHTPKTNSLTCRLELRSRKGVTSNTKSRLANFKGAPGKVPWKNPSRKKNNAKMDPHHADATKTFNDLDAA